MVAPTIIDFDLGAGTATGLTCGDCTVEFFSDDDDEGETYEGQTTADDAGSFAFDKGTAFTGPHLTATATDASGNTSTFSAPAGGGQTIVVTSTADSGAGTLRRALEDAQGRDTITFDPVVFPPTAPVTISITSALPDIHASNLTIDASNAGVVLDGSRVPGNWAGGLQIVSSHGNTIRGLQVSNFSGPGIAISGDAQCNVIGGDRDTGSGPFGQGNLLIHNDMGVCMSSGGTSVNTITGNLIGTDGAGASGLGNRVGVGITEGANGNTIGPDNVMAYNSYRGVELHEQGTLYNTMTRNSIHDNISTGIELIGGNAQLAAPVILDFDLTAGTVRGASCRDCIVEVFSDSGEEGGIYEGTATADHAGVFTFSKGAPLIGPHLTATNTDIDGNTSSFSVPTSGAVGSLTLQRSNDLPVTQFQARQSAELLDNRIGLGLSQFGTQESWDLTIYPRGAKRSRVPITGIEPELVDWDRPEFSVSPYDDVITRMADNGLAITYVLIFWDKATWHAGVGAPCARFKTQDEIDRYLAFVEFMVHHFKDRVERYELWNEPDIAYYCPKWIEMADYTNLVEQTVPVIRADYPEAKVSVGSVSNTEFGGYDYLLELLESDIMPLVDVIAWHPMYGPSPEYEVCRDYWSQYPSMVQEIKDTARVHGFDGEYQADELGWGTVPRGENLVYSPVAAMKYMSRAIVMHLGLDVAVDLSMEAGNTLANLCTVMAGTEPVTLPVRIQGTVTDTVTYTFSLPGDDRLVALWTDGIALQHDPGITTTVILPGLTDHTVTGIDVFQGFRQPVITSEESGDLVIQDLLVKDYPIMLRVSPIRRVFLPVVLKGYAS